MDIADSAEHKESLAREAAINAARNNTGQRLTHAGECHHCGEEVEKPKLFCNGECATKFESKKR